MKQYSSHMFQCISRPNPNVGRRLRIRFSTRSRGSKKNDAISTLEPCSLLQVNEAGIPRGPIALYILSRIRDTARTRNQLYYERTRLSQRLWFKKRQAQHPGKRKRHPAPQVEQKLHAVKRPPVKGNRKKALAPENCGFFFL